MQDLQQVMFGESGMTKEIFNLKQLKRVLENHYGTKVSITTIKQSSNVVIWTSKVETIIQEAYVRSSKMLSDMDRLIEVIRKSM